MSFAEVDARPKSSSTSSSHNGSRSQEQWYRFEQRGRQPFQLQHNERDTELWQAEGNCYVWLEDASAISTCFRLNSTTLEQHHALYLLQQLKPKTNGDDHNDGQSHCQEIYVAIPPVLSSDEIAEYHVTTRNYFAYLHDKPLVGTTLGTSARDVWLRIRRWHESNDSDAFLQYCQRHGYLSFLECPDNALSMLVLADAARLRPLWIDAFAHCVAMQDQLSASPEYAALSNTTKALITKSSLAMDLHIRRNVTAVGNFLSAELGEENLGLSRMARDHMNQFRRMLHAWFADKFGFYPPTENEDEFDKCIWTEVHDDFQALYDLLADTGSSNETLGDRGVTGGLCVHQNVAAFNQRHDIQALPHPLPLLPSLTPLRRATESQVSLRNLRVARLESSFRPSAREALEQASNRGDRAVEKSIVHEFFDFEAERLEGKLPIAEARKVRWLLVYATLQLLKSMVLAPEHVSSVGQAHYPLCVSQSVFPTWTDGRTDKPLTPAYSQASAKPVDGLAVPDADDTDRVSIHPDCEASNAQDFFAAGRRSSLHGSTEGDDTRSDTTTPGTALSRTFSIKSSVHSSMNALQKSVIGSLTRRASSRKSIRSNSKRQPTVQLIASLQQPANEPCAMDEFNFDIPRTRATSDDLPVPVLEAEELDMITPSHWPRGSSIDEDVHSPASSTSDRSSLHEDCETPITQPSSRTNSTGGCGARLTLASLDEDSALTLLEHSPSRTPDGGAWSSVSLNTGCYVPSGYVMHGTPVSKFSKRQVYVRLYDAEPAPIASNETQLRRSNATRRLSMVDGRW